MAETNLPSVFSQSPACAGDWQPVKGPVGSCFSPPSPWLRKWRKFRVSGEVSLVIQSSELWRPP